MLRSIQKENMPYDVVLPVGAWGGGWMRDLVLFPKACSVYNNISSFFTPGENLMHFLQLLFIFPVIIES